jgi:8-oxo-dGTP pyrophosphatase MutT (NUDIX family)
MGAFYYVVVLHYYNVVLKSRKISGTRVVERPADVEVGNIAAALIHHDAGRLLLVRKAGTQWFMQAGGKIENDESPIHALKRELIEEIGLSISDDIVRYLGCFSSIAASEPDDIAEAEVFHVRCNHEPS